MNTPAPARNYRRSAAFQAAIAAAAPETPDQQLAGVFFGAARLLFVASLALPALQWRSRDEAWSSGPSGLPSVLGVQCLILGMLAPAVLSMAFGLFRPSRQMRSAALGVLTSTIGFLCCIGIWLSLESFGATLREGFFCWLLVPLLQAIGFAAQMEGVRRGGLA